MSEARYWESLQKSGLFIYLALFLFFLSIAIFIFLYDRISKYPFWISPLWLKLKIPLIIIGVVGLFAAIIAFARYEGKMELRLAREYAEAKGWKFSRDDTDGLKPLVAVILDDLVFDLYYIRTVGSGPRNIFLFDCSYRNKDASASSKHRLSRGTACIVRSDRFPSQMTPVEITTRDWTEILLSEKVDMGQSSFAQKFLVLSKDSLRARLLINGDIQSIMLQQLKKPIYNPIAVTIGLGGAVVLTGRTYEHERLDDLIDLAVRIEEAI